MTIMTDRSQGGAVIDKSKIELMINRRLYYDDNRGVDEALNETDSLGHGITVPLSFYMEIFLYKEDKSLQRF